MELPTRPPRLSLLVVDDDADMATSQATVLGLHGHRVRTALSPHEAIHEVAQEPPDVVLLDIQLPEMSGWELARILKDRSPSTVVIAVTGCSTVEDHVKSYETGIHFHMVKPVNPGQLLMVLDRVAVSLTTTPKY